MLHDRQAFERTLRQLPNRLTWARLGLVVPFLAAAFAPMPWGAWAAFWIFVAAAATDFLDGWLARQMGATSEFGAWLDPIADKVLVAAALLVLIAKGQIAGIHLAPAGAILVREVAMARARADPTHGSRFPVSPLARWKTAAQMGALALLLYALTAAADTNWVLFGLGALWAAAGLSLFTGWVYLKSGKAPNGVDLNPPDGGENDEGVVLRLDQARDRRKRGKH